MASTPAPGEPIVIDAHGRHAQAVAFSKDGKWLVSTGQDACIRLWSVPGFQAAGVFEGHANSVNSISLSPDGSLLATGSPRPVERHRGTPSGYPPYHHEPRLRPALAEGHVLQVGPDLVP